MKLDAPDGFNGVMVRSGVGLVDPVVIVVAPRGRVAVVVTLMIRMACEFLEAERDGEDRAWKLESVFVVLFLSIMEGKEKKKLQTDREGMSQAVFITIKDD